MTTKAIMRTRIAKELRRTGAALITADIDEAIETAIGEYQTHRFTFNETRDVTFDTVADQAIYTVSDDAEIANIIELDFVTLAISGQTYQLVPGDLMLVELSTSSSSGMPSEYVVFDESIRIWPAPASSGWTCRLGGHFIVAPPTDDDTAGNPWMTTAEKLIRCRAKRELALHRYRDTDLAALMGNEEMDALARLERRRTSMLGTGRIASMSF
ncbi:MAG: hypothetical protein IPL79_20480 [Myxococcales bacterium]|nr:hypothetical protein [Myxococcales bacterium]